MDALIKKKQNPQQLQTHSKYKLPHLLWNADSTFFFSLPLLPFPPTKQ